MILDRKQLLILWIGLGFLLAAFVWDGIFSGEHNLYRYSSLIENNLQQQEYAAEKVLNNKPFIERLINTEGLSNIDTVLSERLQQNPFNICIYKNDSLVFWTRNDVLPNPSSFGKADTIVGKTYIKLIEWKQSQYELRYRRVISKKTNEPFLITALIPIKLVYGSFEGKYLESHFVASPLIPMMIELSRDKKNRYAIKTIEQEFLCGLDLDMKNQADRMHDIGMVCFLVFGLFMLGMFGDRMAKQMLIQNRSPMMGIVFFIGTLIALRISIIFIEGSSLLPTTDLQLPPYSNALFIHSLSELIINTVFLFWFSIFLNKELNLSDFKSQAIWKRSSAAVLFYTAVAFLNIVSIGIFNDLISYWKNILTFENLTQFNTQSVVIVVVISLIQISVFLISHRLISSIKDFDIDIKARYISQTIGILIGALFYQSKNLTVGLPVVGYIVFLFIYIAIYEQFLNYKEKIVSWLIIWILIFSATQAFFVSRLSIDKERRDLYDYAVNLANERDLVAEGHIKSLIDTIKKDVWMNTRLFIPFDFDSEPKKIEQRINLLFQTDDYLSDHYSFNFWGITEKGEAVINPDSIRLQQLEPRFKESKLYTKECKCNFWTNRIGENAYLANIILPFRKENPLTITLEFTRVDKMSSRVFTEILADKHYKRLPQLNEYSYAIYKNGISVEQNQYGTYERFIARNKIPPPGTYRYDFIDNQDQIIYQSKEGIIVYISKYISLSSQTMTLSIYFILVLTTVLLLLTLINQYYNFLPEVIAISNRNYANSSLSYRIMIPVIIFIFASYAGIFIFTFVYYKKIGDKYFTSGFENKAKTVMKNLRNDFKDNIQDNKKLIDNCLKRYSDTYEMALHFYDTKGILIATTEDNIFEKPKNEENGFDKGILARRMNPNAFLKLRLGLDNTYKSDENIGNFHYKSSFYTLKDSTDKNIIGFIELPFYARDRNLRLSIGDIWSYTATVLTLLFILAIVFISSRIKGIIKPLQRVAETLRRLRVEKTVKNELIPWDKKDEIGALISAYNTKVTELEEAILQLAIAEREGAWREMARQVAHEIRNPLTPMKLVVQHVEMMRLQGKPDLNDYIRRSNRVVLEQIKSLEKIVNDFHSFARMNMPSKGTSENFLLNDLVQSVADLFSQHNHNGKKIELILKMPKEQFVIYAERTLLNNAFNNLITNAIQAIPPERDGIIQVNLYREENKAVVKISDNGSGIPNDIKDKIFSPNFTTKSYGSGIGLLITKNIIQSINGKIDFDSHENQGSDFFVELEIVDSYF